MVRDRAPSNGPAAALRHAYLGLDRIGLSRRMFLVRPSDWTPNPEEKKTGKGTRSGFWELIRADRRHKTEK